MILFKVALRNVFRHRARSLITLSAIAFGCSSLIFVAGYFEDTLHKMREGYIKAHTGHIQVYQKGFLEKGSAKPYDYLIEEPENIASLIRQIDGVHYVTRRLEFAGLISTGDNTTSCLGQGIEPKNEPTVRSSDENPKAKKSLRQFMEGSVIETGEPLRDEDTFAVILGKGLASGIGAQVGDGLILVANTVGGSINALDVVVRGTFRTGSKAFDDHFLRLPLSTTQKLLHTEFVQSLVLLLAKTDETPRVRKELEQLFQERGLSLELKTWNELTDFYTKTEVLFGQFFFVVKAVVAVIVVLSIFNTMNMAVLERTSEIGTLMALGTKRRGIISLFLWEGALLGLLGGILGVGLGSLSTWLIAQIGIPMPPPPGATMNWLSEPQVVPSSLFFALVLSLATSLVSSLYPAYKASRLEIAQALRYVG